MPIRLTAGLNDGPRSWGPGYNDGPNTYGGPTWYHNRGMRIWNRTAQDIMIPEGTEAERNSVYRNISAITERETCDWFDATDSLRRDTISRGSSFWSGPAIPGYDRPAPPACPAGYTDNGVASTVGPTYEVYDDSYFITGNYTHYYGTVPVANWLSTYGEHLDIRYAGSTRSAVFQCFSLVQGYFWLAPRAFPYHWMAVRMCTLTI